jgi:hypothetical protein
MYYNWRKHHIKFTSISFSCNFKLEIKYANVKLRGKINKTICFDRRLRPMINALACSNGMPECLDAAATYFSDWMDEQV